VDPTAVSAERELTAKNRLKFLAMSSRSAHYNTSSIRELPRIFGLT